MQEFVMLIGPSGSGKTTYAKQLLPLLNNGILVCTDDIRQNLLGDASDQSQNSFVWQEAHRKIRAGLLGGHDVILDATNMSRKDRYGILAELTGIPDVRKECTVVLCSPEGCMEHQNGRGRKVAYDVVMHQLKKFSMPTAKEGWDDIRFYCTEPVRKPLQTYLEQLDGLSQSEPWHTEDALQHTNMVLDYVREHFADREILQEAARAHDIGKYYTKTVDEEGHCHFFGHANVSSWLYLCSSVQNPYPSEETLYTAFLIENHMKLHDRAINHMKLRGRIGDKAYNDLVKLNEADTAGSVTEEKFRNMSLLEFLHTFSDWKERIRKPPLCIKVSEKDGMFLFKYTQFESDMGFRIVRESRGCILKTDENGRFRYVCRPFDKFFNYGEQYATAVSWYSARVTEKIDGSLMKCFFADGSWHLATSGTIDAFDAAVSDLNITFGEIFERNIGMTVSELGKYLDKDFTYMFELTSPETRIVIPYKNNVYYLSRRNTLTGKEIFDKPDIPNVRFPKTYPLTSVSEVLDTVKKMTKDEEGFVVNDRFGARLKFKSPEYLIAAHIIGNGNISVKRIIGMMREETLDDFLAYAPDYRKIADDVLLTLENVEKNMNEAWENVRMYRELPKPEFVKHVAQNPYAAFLFCMYDGKVGSAHEFLEERSPQYLFRAVERYKRQQKGEKEN